MLATGLAVSFCAQFLGGSDAGAYLVENLTNLLSDLIEGRKEPICRKLMCVKFSIVPRGSSARTGMRC